MRSHIYQTNTMHRVVIITPNNISILVLHCSALPLKGTGKSYVLRVLQDIMENLGLSDKIAFTAPTGVAACNVRGLTIHSWSGIERGMRGYFGISERTLASQCAVSDSILVTVCHFLQCCESLLFISVPTGLIVCYVQL